MTQWINEIYNHSAENSIKVHCFHGNERYQENPLAIYDVVITSYGTLQTDWSSQAKLLFAFHWDRIILDEAHLMKGKNTQTAKAAYEIIARSR